MATTRIAKRTVATSALIIMLGVMSACSSSGLSFVPSSLRATIAAEDAKEGRNKISVDDILTSAREEDTRKNQTVLAKTRGKFASIFKRKKKNDDYSPAFEPDCSVLRR